MVLKIVQYSHATQSQKPL